MKNLPLKFRMMLFSTVMVILVVASISSFLLYFHHKAVWTEFDLRADSISGALARELELMVLLEDKAGIERILKGALKLQDVLSVSVWDKKGELLMRKGMEPSSAMKDMKVVEHDIELEPAKITEDMMAPALAGKPEKIGRMSVAFSSAKLKAKLEKMVYFIILATLIVIVLRLLADYLFTKGITRPIEKLVQGSEAVAGGDLAYRIDIEGGKEISRLAMVFNKMVVSLREREEDLNASHLSLKRSYKELAATNEELLRAKKISEIANETKSQFLANMSHELRTPLTAIIGFTQLLLGGKPSSEQKDYMERVNQAGKNLLKLVDGILDLIKVESGDMKLELVSFDLIDVLESNLRPLAWKAHKKGLEFLVYISPDTPVALRGDPSRLMQVLINLLENAIKFTKAGEISLLITLEERTMDSSNMFFSVRDTGIGISKVDQEIVFESFRQADGSSTRRYGGAGLGATISRQLVELMGGRIWVESEEGIGSSFNFTLNCKIQADRQDETAGHLPAPLPRLRVLAADDNDNSRRIIHRMLDFWNLKTEVCASGQDAIDMVLAAQSVKAPFDVCILDSKMPGLDGPETVKRLINGHGFNPSKIILLVQEEITEEAREKIDPDVQVLAKPVFQPELYHALSQIVEGGKGQSTIDNRQLKIENQQLEDLAYKKTRNILVVEDNPSNLELVKCALEIKGFNVEVAENGKAALDILEEKPCDLILMDIQMPVMDGFEATEAIRKREAGGRRTPIIALTAHAIKGDQEKCLKMGMDGYVSKPVDLKELIDTVSRHL
ncbi:MAG: response regulator [Nitrospinae bacterium]|nr:response regulator [Nitrospinota bacterium]